MAEVPPEHRSQRELLLFAGRFILGLAVLGGGVALITSRFREELSVLGHSVVEEFGLLGMAGGTVVAEAFQFPVPPQLYMLASIAAGASPARVLVAITVGSIAGGHLGMFIARRAARFRFVRRTLERGVIVSLFKRHGALAVTLGSILPFPFSILCYSCGLLNIPYRLFLVVCALRVPKLLLYYVIIRTGFALA